jgi:hypothetical protein
VYLTRGTVINNIVWLSGSTAGVTMTHQWGVVANSARSVVAVTADGVAAAIGANATITYPITSPAASYTVPTSGLYYIGVMVAATTPPTFAGATGGNAASSAIPPILAGTSNSGATTPPALAATLTAITATANVTYIYLT